MANLLARLDREAERRRVSELKANNGMRDPGRSPVVDREVDACDLRDAHSARLPMRGIGRYSYGCLYNFPRNLALELTQYLI